MNFAVSLKRTLVKEIKRKSSLAHKGEDHGGGKSE